MPRTLFARQEEESAAEGEGEGEGDGDGEERGQRRMDPEEELFRISNIRLDLEEERRTSRDLRQELVSKERE